MNTAVAFLGFLAMLGAMRRLAAILLALFVSASCRAAIIPAPEMRHRNYVAGRMGGSCLPVSFVNGLEASGGRRSATWVKASYRGKMHFQTLASRATRDGIPVVATYDGDRTFFDRVDWAVVSWRGWNGDRHAILFCGWENRTRGRVAVLLESNSVKTMRWCPEAEFIQFWQGCGGDAVALDRKR